MTPPKIAFPGTRVPDDPHLARLLGLYPQRQEGRWMQRVKVLGGRLSADAWRALAAAARRHTPGTPLHLTTRQDIELHDLSEADVPAVQRLIAEAGLTTVGACGDTLRNVTVCPCSGLRPGTPDLEPLAWTLRRVIEAMPGATALPRKFKISLSACAEACGRPWVNDLGLVAEKRDGRWGFRAIVAGSLGAKPGTGILFDAWIPARNVAPLARGAVRFFAAHGDRENRRRARLRHVRERMGENAFLESLRAHFEAARAEQEWPEPPLPEPSAACEAERILTLSNGDVTPDQADALADLASRDDVAVRLAIHHRIHIFASGKKTLAAALAAHPPLAAALESQPSVVACPGTRWCKRALADTNALADRLRATLAGDLPPEATVCISGCPNGCAHSAVADVGLTGGRVRDGAESRDAWTLRVGGGGGRSPKPAEVVARRLAPAEVAAAVRAHAQSGR